MPLTLVEPQVTVEVYADEGAKRRIFGALVVFALFLAVQLAPRPASIKPEGWRLLAIFVAAVGGLILRPIPGGAVVLIAVTLAYYLGRSQVQADLVGFAHGRIHVGRLLASSVQHNLRNRRVRWRRWRDDLWSRLRQRRGLNRCRRARG